VVIFEDLHWIDAETREVLDLLVDSVASARIIMLVKIPARVPVHECGHRHLVYQLR